MLKYTLILYCSFCLSFGDKNRVTSLLYQVLIKPIGKLSLFCFVLFCFVFFLGGGEGAGGSVILIFRNTVYTAVQPKRLIWLERNNHRQRPLPTHQKKKSIFTWSMLVFQLSYNIIVLFAYPVVTILSSVTVVTFYYLFCSPFQNRAWD